MIVLRFIIHKHIAATGSPKESMGPDQDGTYLFLFDVCFCLHWIKLEYVSGSLIDH